MNFEREKVLAFFLVRIFISLLFIYSGLEKIKDISTFAVAIENYHIMPFAVINLTAVWLPWIEVFTGVLLFFNFYPKENLAIIFLLISIFTIAVASAIIRGINIDCGCFGAIGTQKTGIQKIVENILLLIAIAVLFLGYRKKNLMQHSN